MRLGKEKATGYVEDTEADMVLAEEITMERSEQTPLTPAPEPPLPVSLHKQRDDAAAVTTVINRGEVPACRPRAGPVRPGPAAARVLAGFIRLAGG